MSVIHAAQLLSLTMYTDLGRKEEKKTVASFDWMLPSYNYRYVIYIVNA